MLRIINKGIVSRRSLRFKDNFVTKILTLMFVCFFEHYIFVGKIAENALIKPEKTNYSKKSGCIMFWYILLMTLI